MLEASQRQVVNAQAEVEALQQQLVATQARDAQEYQRLQEQAGAAAVAHGQVTVPGCEQTLVMHAVRQCARHRPLQNGPEVCRCLSPVRPSQIWLGHECAQCVLVLPGEWIATTWNFAYCRKRPCACTAHSKGSWPLCMGWTKRTMLWPQALAAAKAELAEQSAQSEASARDWAAQKAALEEAQQAQQRQADAAASDLAAGLAAVEAELCEQQQQAAAAAQAAQESATALQGSLSDAQEQLRQQAGESAAAARTAEASLSSLQAQLSEAAAALQQARTEACAASDASKAQVLELEGQLQLQRDQLQSAEASASGLRDALSEADTRAEQLGSDLAAARSKLGAAEATALDLRGNLAAAQQDCTESRAQLNAAALAEQGWRQELAEAGAQLADQQRRHADAVEQLHGASPGLPAVQ